MRLYMLEMKGNKCKLNKADDGEDIEIYSFSGGILWKLLKERTRIAGR